MRGRVGGVEWSGVGWGGGVVELGYFQPGAADLGTHPTLHY